MRYILMAFKRSMTNFASKRIQNRPVHYDISNILFYSIDLMPINETLAFQTHTHILLQKKRFREECKYCELVCENDSLISHAIIIHVVCFKLGVNKLAIENNEEKNEHFDNKFVLLLLFFKMHDQCTLTVAMAQQKKKRGRKIYGRGKVCNTFTSVFIAAETCASMQKKNVNAKKCN